MKLRWTLFAVALLALAVPALADAHMETKAEAPAAPEMSAEEKAMMEAMMKAATPGEAHKQLARMAGDWTFKLTGWMPDGKTMESTGTMHAETMLDGRYVHAAWKGEFAGMPFEGHGFHGWDNVGKQAQGTWMDNMSTGMMYSTGTCDDAGTCTETGSYWDPMTGKQTTSRSTVSWSGNDSFKVEMYGPGPDGKEMKTMEIVATRKK